MSGGDTELHDALCASTGVRTPAFAHRRSHTGAGVSSRFRSQEDVEADMTSAQGQATHQTVLELPLPPPSVHLEEEEQRMTPEEVTAFFNLDGLL